MPLVDCGTNSDNTSVELAYKVVFVERGKNRRKDVISRAKGLARRNYVQNTGSQLGCPVQVHKKDNSAQ